MTKVYITESGYKLNVASTLRMTASEAETLLDGVFEPALGNPDANGYVLSSTAAGVRSWVEGGGGASDVDDLATSTGSSTNMLRVAAAGGLEYRTTAQVLSDIGAAPTASPTFTGTVTMAAATVTGNVTVTNTVGFRPASNTTSWPLVQDAAGAAVVTVDTTNKKMIVEQQLDINIGKSLSWGGGQTYTISKGGAGLYFKSWIFPAQFAGVAGVVMNIGTDNGLSTIGHGNTATAAADIAASTTAAASLRLRSGTAPTSPNEGDIWFDGTNLKMYDGTTTRTISWT